MRFILIYSLCLLFTQSFSQHGKEITMNIYPILNGAKCTFDETSDEFHLTTLRFYLSNVEFYNNNRLLHRCKNSFHLIDASVDSSLSFAESMPESMDFTHIKFNVGIDSVTSAQGVHGGALDPMHGMYWTWQSGYINFKLEGVSPDCPARLNKFQFHIGGYQHPFNTIQQVVLDVPNSQEISLSLNLDVLFDRIDLSQTYEVLSPNEQAMEFANFLPQLFELHHGTSE